MMEGDFNEDDAYRNHPGDSDGSDVRPMAPLVLPTLLPSTVHFSAASTPPRVLLTGFEKFLVVSSASLTLTSSTFSSSLLEQNTNSLRGCSALGLPPGGILFSV